MGWRGNYVNVNMLAGTGAAAMEVEEATTPKASDTEAASADSAARSANGGTPSRDGDGKEKVCFEAAFSRGIACAQ
jgi:hypothetical protein